MTRWEYKRVITSESQHVASEDFEPMLNELGREGWELVASVSRERHGHTLDVYLIFKRPLP
jgi:hypothetical protein